MNWDQVQGSWKQFKGQVKQKWGDLTDDEIDRVEGRQEELAGLIQKKYGKTWTDRCGLRLQRADRRVRRHVKFGVIDPAKVVRTALQDAASVAGLLITTEAMIADKPEPKGQAGGGMPGGMGGMEGMM